MRRVIALLRRDLVASRRDPMILLLLGTSLLFALLLRSFLGGFEQTGGTVAISRAEAPSLQAGLASVVDVQVVRDEQAVRAAVHAAGDVVGIVVTPTGSYGLLLTGDEPTELRAVVSAVLVSMRQSGVPPRLEEVAGDRDDPLLARLAVLYGLAAIFLGGLVMGFNIIEDKEMRTMQALGVSPLSQREYLGGRSVLVLLMGLVFGYVSLLAIGAPFDPLQVGIVLAAGVPLGVLTGFVLGAVSGNVIQGIANLKLGWIVVLLPGLATWFAPAGLERWLWILPQYWLFAGFRHTLVDGGSTAGLVIPVAALLLTTTVAAGALYPLLRRRLAFVAG